MFQIGSFIEEVRKKIDRPRVVRQQIAHIIGSSLSIEIKTDSINIKSQIIQLEKLPPVVRQNLVFKKKYILDRIKSEVGMSFSDIR